MGAKWTELAKGSVQWRCSYFRKGFTEKHQIRKCEQGFRFTESSQRPRVGFHGNGAEGFMALLTVMDARY